MNSSKNQNNTNLDGWNKTVIVTRTQSAARETAKGLKVKTSVRGGVIFC